MFRTRIGFPLKRLIPVGLLLTGIVLFPGCSKSSAPLNSANVMFVNGCLDAPSVNVIANHQGISGLAAIPFLTNTGYTYVTAGSGVTLTFSLANSSGTPFASRSVNMVASGHYSAFAGGVVSDSIYLFTVDDLTPPSNGTAKMRCVKLSPDNIAEKITVNDTFITEGITLNTASPYFQIRQGYSYIKVFDPTRSGRTIITDTVYMAPGKIYTYMLTGTATGALTDSLLLTPILNN